MEKSDLSKTTVHFGFDLRKEKLYNEFRSHWANKSLPEQCPHKHIGYKDIIASLNCKIRKKKQHLNQQNNLLKLNPIDEPNICSSFFLTSQNSQPATAPPNPQTSRQIKQLSLQTSIQTQKHQQLKLDSFKLTQQTSLISRKIRQLRHYASSIPQPSDLTTNIARKQTRQCLITSKRRYHMLNQQQSKLLDMQNRMYLEQHQKVVESEEGLIRTQGSIEVAVGLMQVLSRRKRVLEQRLQEQDRMHQAMVAKIQQYGEGDCQADKLQGYIQIQKFMERVEAKRRVGAMGSGSISNWKSCSFNQIDVGVPYKQELSHRTTKILEFYNKLVQRSEQLLNMYEQRLQVYGTLHATLQSFQPPTPTPQPCTSTPNRPQPQLTPSCSSLTKSQSTFHCNTLAKSQDRRNSSLFTIMAFEQRCLYIFSRCLKLIKLIFSTWNKYDTVLMDKLHNLEEEAKVELKENPLTRVDLENIIKKYFQNWDNYGFWVQEMIRNKFLGRYLQFNIIEQSLVMIVIRKKQCRKASTHEMLWQSLVNLNCAACSEAVKRVKFSLSKTLEIVKICRETRKPIINRAVKRIIRQQSQPKSLHRVDQQPSSLSTPSIPLKHLLQKLISKDPFKSACNDLSLKQKQLQIYRLQLFSHSRKSASTTARSRRNGKFELIRNYPRVGSQRASPRTSINYEMSETWIE